MPSTVPGDAAASAPPFFIVGCGRSGTTLLRAMLNQHPELCVPPEALSLLDLLRGADRPIERLRRFAVADPELRLWDIDLRPERLADCASAVEIVERVHRLCCEARGKSRWGHKTPRLVRHPDTLIGAFPSARFIHVVRDPRAVALSFTESKIHRSNALHAARRWRRDTAAGADVARRFPDRTLELRYEDLVREPEPTLRAVCAFIGLDYHPSLLDYHRTGASEYDAYHQAVHSRLNAPPDPARIERWREKLSRRRLRVVDHVAGELMRRYGYEPVADRPASNVDRLIFRVRRVGGLAGQIGYSLRVRGDFLPMFVWRKIRLGLARDLAEFNF